VDWGRAIRCAPHSPSGGCARVDCALHFAALWSARAGAGALMRSMRNFAKLRAGFRSNFSERIAKLLEELR